MSVGVCVSVICGIPCVGILGGDHTSLLAFQTSGTNVRLLIFVDKVTIISHVTFD